jgi:hypothetical protein
MAVSSPAHDPAWSLGRAALRASETGAGSATPSGADGEAALDLGLMRAVIQDGLLMVLGPEGDPVPPQAFCAAAAAQPDTEVRLGEGSRIRAERMAAVLDAQRGGRLGSGRGGDDAWIEAMLGIGPQPGTASEADLAAERHTVEIIAFGRELMITSPAGGTFLIAAARSATPASVRLVAGDGEPVALGSIVARLLGRSDRDDAGKPRARVNEVTLPDCGTWTEDGALVVDLPEVGELRFQRHDPAAGHGPLVSVFMPDGETATIDQLMSTLSRPLTSPAAEDLLLAQVDPAMAGPSVAADLDPASEPRDPPSSAPHRVALGLRLPERLGPLADKVALVVVRRLPPGAVLSAGVACDDGSWLVSPRDLSGLSLGPPAGSSGELTLEVVAIAVRDRDGELASVSTTIAVPLRPAPGGQAPAPIAVAIDSRALSRDGAPLDALIVRDLPAGATLSAGAYDPAIDGWVLLPRQAGTLRVTPGIGQTDDFTLTLLGVRLSDAPARPRLLARIPIALRRP